MRQITIDAIRAFRNGEDFKRGNTEVKWAKGLRTQLLLHGNVIAVKDIFGNLSISNGGHTPKNDATGSITTKERLNGLPNVSLYQTDFQWFLNGEAWDGEFILVE